MDDWVLVTGGAGFIGSHIVDRLVAQGRKVIALDNMSTGKRENLNPGAVFYESDIGDSEQLRQVFQKHQIAYVIHEAAKINLNITLEDPLIDVSSTVLGTINLLRCCVDNGIKKLVYASSVSVYGRSDQLPVGESGQLTPVYSYGIAKKCAEDYIKFFGDNYGLNYSILRYANVYGPRQPIYGEVGVVAIFTDRVANGGPLTIYGDGSDLRDYIFVDDVVDVTLQTMQDGDREIFNVGYGAGTSVIDLFNAFDRLCSSLLTPVHKPARTGELGSFFTTTEKAKRLLKWQAAVDLEQGIKATLEHYGVASPGI